MLGVAGIIIIRHSVMVGRFLFEMDVAALGVEEWYDQFLFGAAESAARNSL